MIPLTQARALGLGAAALFLVSLLVTILLYTFVVEPRVERVLFFPGTVTSDLTGERRVLPRFQSKEENLRAFVEDLILGPTSIYSSPALPEDTQVQLFMLRNDALYLDLSEELLFNGNDVHLTPAESLAALRKNIAFNFPHLRDIVLTVNGYLPFEPPFLGVSGEPDGAAAISR